MLPAASATPLLTTQHVDISLANGSNLSLRWHNHNAVAVGGYFFSADGATGYIDPVKSRRIRPEDTKWDFLGVAAGGEFFLLPATQNNQLLYLGFGAGNAIPGSFDVWNPSDTLRNVNTSQRWIQVHLKGVTGPGDFSVYTVSGGNPRIWMDSADGIHPSISEDSLYVVEGGHSHYNLAFTHEGNYQLHFQLRAYKSGSLITSEGTLNFTTSPELKIDSKPSNQITLSWPSLSEGFILKKSKTLHTGSWSIVPELPIDNGQTNSLILPVTTNPLFFRLEKP